MAAPIRTRMVPRRMTTDLLTLTQLMSPAFPVGAFAYSHGLEAAVEAGVIKDAQSLEAWITDLVEIGSAHADAVFLNAAFSAKQEALDMLDAQVRAFAASSERLMEADLQGAAFCDTVNGVWGLHLPHLTYAVAVGHVAQRMDLDVEQTTALYLQAFVANLCAAALRSVPLGQLDGQKVQMALQPICIAKARTVVGATLDDAYSNTWMSDIASMRHETQYSRIFRT